MTNAAPCPTTEPSPSRAAPWSRLSRGAARDMAPIVGADSSSGNVSIEDLLLLARYKFLLRLVPILYGMVIVATLLISYAARNLSSPIIAMTFPTLFMSVIVHSLSYWINAGKNKNPTPAIARRDVESTGKMGPLLAGAFAVVAATQLRGDAIDETLLIGVSIWVAAIMCAFCLFVVPRAATFVVLFATAPILGSIMFRGGEFSILLSALLSVFSALAIFLFVELARQFSDIVRARALATEKHRHAEETKELLADRSAQLVDAQTTARMADWSYRMGEADMWWAPELFDILAFDPRSFRPARDTLMERCLGDGARRVLESQAAVLRARGAQKVDVKFRRGDGSVGDFVVTSKALLGADGAVVGFSGTIQDITERKRVEEQLEQLAYYDPLTGLANRSLFRREVEDSVRRWRALGSQSAILLLDLDHFKEVNDSLGHAAGDELLVQAAHLFARAIGPKNFLARLGGDEFAVIVRDGASPAACAQIAQALIHALAEPIKLTYGEVSVGASVGIVNVCHDYSNAEELLRCADLALYRAKDEGRSRLRFFTLEMSESVHKKVTLGRDLRQALAGGDELTAQFQPQVDLATGRVIAFEALTRWRHPTLGLVPPTEFIPISESSHLIIDLGVWILRQSARAAAAWVAAGEAPRQVSVNVSAAQIWHSDFVNDVAEVLSETRLDPSLLCLELTESLFVDNSSAKVRVTLEALKALGVDLALDDFGTGYSSLGYLAKLPFDKLKIDRTFVNGVDASPKKAELLRGIVGIGRGLGMSVVAEGAETLEEVNALRALGCDVVQGFYYAKPAPVDEALRIANAIEAGDVPAAALERDWRMIAAE